MNEVRIYARFIPIRIRGDYVVMRMYTTDYNFQVNIAGIYSSIFYNARKAAPRIYLLLAAGQTIVHFYVIFLYSLYLPAFSIFSIFYFARTFFLPYSLADRVLLFIAIATTTKTQGVFIIIPVGAL